jgi:drug/metabolite transporter (DMT)-like permease
MSRRGLVLFLSLSVIWGLPYFMIRVALREVDPGTLIMMRTVPAALLILPWAGFTGRLTPLLKHAKWVVIYTVCEFGIPWLLMTEAERRITSSLTALLVACVPLSAAVIYRFTIVRERFGTRRITGLLMGAAGVALVVGLSVTGSSGIGVLLMVGVVIGYTIGPLIIATKLSDLPGAGVIGVSVGLVALAYAPWGVTHLPSQMTASVIAAVAVLALVCTALGFLVFFALIVEVGPSRSTVVTYINPAVAVLLGVAFLSEPLNLGIIIGFPMIVLGSILATGRAAGDLDVDSAKARSALRRGSDH